MKKFLFLLSIYILSYAQIGAKAGLNIYNPNFNRVTPGASTFDGKKDFLLGLTYHVESPVLTSFDLELNYARYKSDRFDGSELQTPLSFRVNFLPFPFIKPFFRLGASYNLNLSGGGNFKNYFSYIFALGLGLDIATLPGLNVETRIIIPTTDKSVSSHGFDIKSNQLQITLGMEI